MIDSKKKCKETETECVNACEDQVSKENDSTESNNESDTLSDESFENDDNSAKLAQEAAMWQDKYLRLVAEFDNYRKRTLKEKMDLVATGGEDVIKSLLGVIDDLDRALMSMENVQDVKSVKEGVVLIHQKLMDTLRSKGVSEIEAIGHELDTDLHEAVAKFAASEEQKGKIIDVVQKGYKLKDKVVRFAKVVVGE